MAKNKKIRSGVWLVFKSLIVGSVVVSRVFAAPTPVTPSHDGLINDWRSVGNQMSGNQSALPLLNDHLIDMIAAADLDKNLAEVVAASYEMVDQSQISALDAHWASVLTATDRASLVAEFLDLRSTLDFGSTEDVQVDNLVWLASKPNGNGCDGDPSGQNNGHGNGDQTAPGNSDDPNNAENSENSGQGNSGQGNRGRN